MGSPVLKRFYQAGDHEQAGVSGRVRPKTPGFLPALNCFDGGPDCFGSDFLAKRLYVPSNPFTDLRQAKLAAVHCSPDKAAINELVPSFRIDFDVEPIASQEDISGGEGDPLVAVEKAVIVAERLHQRGRFFFEGVVIADLGAENGGLNRILVANPVPSAEPVDQEVLHLIHLGDR